MKKYLLFIAVFILIFGGLTVLAQSPPPSPPAPLIYSAPEKNELKEYISEEDNFQITFPGVPKISKEEVTNGNVTTYSVNRKGSNSVVTVIDYDFEVENQSEKVFENIKNYYSKLPKATVEAEKEIKVGDVSGKEFDVLRDYQFQKTRIFVIGTRVYEIKSDVTNWHILSKYNKEKVADFNEETRRFFDSFKISITGASLAAPENFIGKVEKNIYKNTSFDFSIEFPAEWVRLDDDEIETAKSAGLNALKTEKQKVNKAFEDATKREVILFYFVNKQNALTQPGIFGFGVLKQPNKRVTAKTVADATKSFLLTNPNIKITREVENIKINNTEFSTFTIETDTQNVKLNQKLYITVRKGYSLTFSIGYFNNEMLQKEEDILKSLKFDVK